MTDIECERCREARDAGAATSVLLCNNPSCANYAPPRKKAKRRSKVKGVVGW